MKNGLKLLGVLAVSAAAGAAAAVVVEKVRRVNECECCCCQDDFADEDDDEDGPRPGLLSILRSAMWDARLMLYATEVAIRRKLFNERTMDW